MSDYKLENYEGSADTFTFPINSTSFDDSNEFHSNVTPVPFDNKHIVITKGSLNPKTLSLQGFFKGVDKLTDWNSLLELSASAKLKKFYFASDRFYLVLGSQFQQSRTGGRNNFIDYVGSMMTPIPFVFSDTLKIASYDGVGWTDGTQTNEGSHQTFIEEVEVTLDGGSAGETFIIDDANIGGIKVTLPVTILNDILKIVLVTMVGTNGYNTTEYWYATLNGDQIQRATSVNKADLDLTLTPGQQVDTLTISGTTSYSNAVVKFRDSWLA